MKILSVVATRPNFIKIAPFIRAIESERKSKRDLLHVLVHTGQHYDKNMSAAFFEEFSLPNPDYNLNIGSGTHAEQDGKTMIAFEKVLLMEKPDWVVVVGDVNATMSSCVTAKKMGIKVCHIEAGIRSGDRSMPEELNRILTDSIADLLLTPDELSVENLKREGRASKDISFVGNIMIDTLDFMIDKANQLSVSAIIESKLLNTQANSLYDEKKKLVLITLHRPSNVDSEENLLSFINWIESKKDENFQFVWTMHPRTLANIKTFAFENRLSNLPNLILLQPLTYSETLAFNLQTDCILTDSGGLQEEACVLGTAFLVLREQTERPSTLVDAGGTGVIAGNIGSDLDKLFYTVLQRGRKVFRPALWDGKTAVRCLNEILLRR